MPSSGGKWRYALAQLVLGWLILLAVTWSEWGQMAHQWFNIDTYNHILLVPPIIGWLVSLRRDELRRTEPVAWWPAIAGVAAGMAVWLAGRVSGFNIVAQAGTVFAFQCAVFAFLGLRAGLIAAFPVGFAMFLVPFGDELIPALQSVTARLAVDLTHLSGVPAIVDGLFIDTPAGRFVVAEECSGVKFLVAMIALAVLVAWTGFSRWRDRILFVAGAAAVSILANGVRAWATIYAAQYVGIERAGGFDHIIYGWVFFAVVIAIVLGLAWRHFDRDPAQAGLAAADLDMPVVARLEGFAVAPSLAIGGVAAVAMSFAVLARLV
ncbi:exosortase [Altererythrobacter aerius]|uniref:Exosortase n=2 Tax=Tsuneonella aeria TaxID=1837929 RepID=A0A6I4TA03_9SPHN|nr:exosortase [Tsuneonella aeria]